MPSLEINYLVHSPYAIFLQETITLLLSSVYKKETFQYFKVKIKKIKEAFIQLLRSEQTAALITSNEVVRIITAIFFLYKQKKAMTFIVLTFLDVVTFSLVIIINIKENSFQL